MLKARTLILAVILLSGALMSAPLAVHAQESLGYINADGVKLLEQPTTDAKILRVFRKGDRIKCMAFKEPPKADAWIEVTILRTTIRGFVPAKYITEGTVASRF